MQKKLFTLLNKWPKPYVSSGDLMMALEGGANAVHSLIKRAVKEGVLIRLRRDFYLISSKIQTSKVEAFEIASLLYGPSYISYESALSFHGWIPEAVPSINSACAKRSKRIETTLGAFCYYHIPVSIFHVGVSSCSREKQDNYLIADPWKAIADIMYVKGKSWPNIMALTEDFRIELDLLQSSDLNLLVILAEKYPSEKVKKHLQIFIKDFNI